MFYIFVCDSGPFVFEESRDKVKISFIDGNKRVQYRQQRRWIFRSDLTPGGESSLNQEICHLNVPLVSAGQFARRMEEPFYFYAVNRMQEEAESQLYPTHTVEQLLFQGYTDPLIEAAAGIIPDMPYDKFGWFYDKNDSSIVDGDFEMFTGVGDVSLLGNINSWKNQTVMTQWQRNTSCSSFKGVSAGDFHPPFPSSRQFISIFVPEICRSLKLKDNGDDKIFSLKIKRFAATDIFDYDIEENKCYCPENGCPPKGVANISECVFGSPAAISFPHFTHASPELINGVDGMKPNASAYPFFIGLDDDLGLPAKIQMSLQINVVLTKDDRLNYSRLSFADNVYYPAIYFTSTAQLSKNMAHQLTLLQNIFGITVYFSILMIILGLCLISFYWHHKRVQNKPESETSNLIDRH